jgi:hypothetical protein
MQIKMNELKALITETLQEVEAERICPGCRKPVEDCVCSSTEKMHKHDRGKENKIAETVSIAQLKEMIQKTLLEVTICTKCGKESEYCTCPGGPAVKTLPSPSLVRKRPATIQGGEDKRDVAETKTISIAQLKEMIQKTIKEMGPPNQIRRPQDVTILPGDVTYDPKTGEFIDKRTGEKGKIDKPKTESISINLSELKALIVDTLTEAKAKWMQKASKEMEDKGTKGALRKHFGVKEGEKIPASKVNAEIAKLKAKEKKTEAETKLLRRLVFAKNAKKAKKE